MKMLKFPFPLDDQWHAGPATGQGCFVGKQNAGFLTLWTPCAEHFPFLFEYKVVGTGDEVPYNAQLIGSIIAGPFVWHLISRAK